MQQAQFKARHGHWRACRSAAAAGSCGVRWEISCHCASDGGVGVRSGCQCRGLGRSRRPRAWGRRLRGSAAEAVVPIRQPAWCAHQVRPHASTPSRRLKGPARPAEISQTRHEVQRPTGNRDRISSWFEFRGRYVPHNAHWRQCVAALKPRYARESRRDSRGKRPTPRERITVYSLITEKKSIGLKQKNRISGSEAWS